MKTLKSEGEYIKEYNTFEEAYNNIKEFIEIVYNKKTAFIYWLFAAR